MLIGRDQRIRFFLLDEPNERFFIYCEFVIKYFRERVHDGSWWEQQSRILFNSYDGVDNWETMAQTRENIVGKSLDKEIRGKLMMSLVLVERMGHMLANKTKGILVGESWTLGMVKRPWKCSTYNAQPWYQNFSCTCWHGLLGVDSIHQSWWLKAPISSCHMTCQQCREISSASVHIMPWDF